MSFILISTDSTIVSFINFILFIYLTEGIFSTLLFPATSERALHSLVDYELKLKYYPFFLNANK